MTADSKAPSAAPATPAKSAVRADIQGLRALAVIAVICNHVTSWPTGGFAGVDVFFVISGFLITGLIVREHSRSGRFSAAGFYGRRIRRIVPAATVTLIATTLAGYFVFNSARAETTLWDAVSAFFFASNWRFASEGTDYFQSLNAVSPLQHFWSLSVEEQFYVLWPLVIVGSLLLSARVWASPGLPRLTLVVVGVTVAVSFIYSVWATAEHPTLSYFSTFSRAWELGVGGLLAVSAPLFGKVLSTTIGAVVRGVAGWIGLAGIVASLLLITEDLPFPGPWALLPVMATALVIVAGIPGPARTLFPLTNPVSVYLGNLSYSLYLWHFPILTFLTLMMPGQGLDVIVMVLGLTLVVSLLSYYLVEQPFLQSPWLRTPRLPGKERRRAWRDWRDKFGMNYIMVFLASVVIATTVYAVEQSPINHHVTAASAASLASVPGEDPLTTLQANLAAATAATSWPSDLTPTLDEVIQAGSTTNPANSCFLPGATPSFDACTWGEAEAPNHLYLVGDSMAMAYAPAFIAIANDSAARWKVTTIGMYGCRFTDFQVLNDGPGVMDTCAARKSDIANQISADNPDLVVVSNAFVLGQTAEGAALTMEQITTGTVAETARYNAAGKLVYLAPPPSGADLGQCYSRVSSPQSCNAEVSQMWSDFASATQQVMGEEDIFINSEEFACFEGVCPAFAGTLPTRYDTVHITPIFAIGISPIIRDALVAQGRM